MQMVKTTNLDAPQKDILVKPEIAFRLTCQIGNTGVVNNADGRKIIPAGTPVGVKGKNVLEERTAVLVVSNTSSDGENAQGILMNDTDVTDGNNSAPVIFSGIIDLTKCPTIDATAKTALASHIIFIKGV